MLFRNIKYYFILFLLTFVYVQNNAQSGWTQKRNTITHRVAATAADVDSKIFLIGGWGGGNTDMTTNEMYDPSSNTWATKAPMPTDRGFLTSAVLNGIIYTIGGRYPSATNKVEAYDPVTNTWTTKKGLNVARANGRTAVIDGRIYVIAGYNIRKCEYYDPETNTWTFFKDYPEIAGGSVSVVAYNGLIYAFGGGYSPGLKTVYSYDPKTDIWEKKCDMPTARMGAQACLLNNKIYVIGGATSQNYPTEAVEMYDPNTDIWYIKSDMPVKSAYLSCAVIDEKIYVFEGTPDWSTGGVCTWEYYPKQDTIEIVVGLEEKELYEIPTAFTLSQNYPNPFNPSTTIKYSIPLEVKSEKTEGKNVTLMIYDILGREVVTLVNERQKPGNYEVTWDADSYSNGIYFYRLTSNNFIETKKMILLK